MPYPLATVQVLDIETECDSGDYQMTLDRCLAEFNWAERAKLHGKLIDGRYHGIAVGCYLEGGGTGPSENARLAARGRRHDLGVRRLVVGRPGRRDGVCADRRRRARTADGPHQQRVPRLDRLRRRGLRLVLARAPSSWAATPSWMPPIGCATLIRDAAAQRLGCAANDIAIDQEMVVGPNRAAIELKAFAGLSADGTLRQQQADLLLWRRMRPMWRSIRGPAMSN